MTAAEAHAYGVVDRVIDKRSAVATQDDK